MTDYSGNSIKHPTGSIWQHKNGIYYTILAVVNQNYQHDPVQFPITIVYINMKNLSIWSRPASDWDRSFTLIPTDKTLTDMPKTNTKLVNLINDISDLHK